MAHSFHGTGHPRSDSRRAGKPFLSPMVFFASLTHDIQTSLPTLIITYFILLLLLGMLVFAHPKVRSRHHDKFERVHRFAGWTAAALVWAQVAIKYVADSVKINMSHSRSSYLSSTTSPKEKLLPTRLCILHLSG